MDQAYHWVGGAEPAFIEGCGKTNKDLLQYRCLDEVEEELVVVIVIELVVIELVVIVMVGMG